MGISDSFREIGAGKNFLSPTDFIVQVDTSIGAVEIVMPKINTVLNSYPSIFQYMGIRFVDISNNASVNNITLTGFETDTINGLTNVVLNKNGIGGTLVLIGDSEWAYLQNKTINGNSINVQSVTGLNTDNTDPQNPVVEISVDGTTITGNGTPANPLVSNSSGVQSVTGLNTDNTDPLNPIVEISVDGTTITGDGTPANPLQANYLPSTSYGVFAQTNSSIPASGITETSIVGTGVGALTVPANSFQIGDSFTLASDGLLSSLSSATLEIRVKTLTGVLLCDTGVIAMASATNKPFLLSLYFTIRTLGGVGVASISSGGLFSYIRNGGTQFEGYVLSQINSTTFDTTVNNTLVVTAQWNTGSASNTIQSFNLILQKVY